MKTFKITAGMLFSLEVTADANTHDEAVNNMMRFIEAVYKDGYIVDEEQGTEFEFVRPTILIVEDEEGNVKDYRFSDKDA